MPYAFSTKVNGVGNVIDAADVNNLQDAITRTAGRIIVPPNDASFSWLNQGTSTVTTDANGDVVLTCPTGTNLRGRIIALPATPYTVTARLIAAQIVGGNSESGLILYDGTKCVTWSAFTSYGGGVTRVTNWTSVSVFSANVASRNPSEDYAQPLRWIRITDDGTTYSFYCSDDGDHWVRFATATRASFMTTPTNIGWFQNNQAGANSDFILHSWEVT